MVKLPDGTLIEKKATEILNSDKIISIRS
jgi:hypothetical protein